MNERLENEKISKLLFAMALPAILAQLATLIYNMVDRIYIARIPDVGTAALGHYDYYSFYEFIWTWWSTIGFYSSR